MAPQLRVSLLGSPEVYLNDELVDGFRSSKARALFYYLAVTGQTHQRPLLAGMLWGEVDELYARRSLNQAVSNLRQIADAFLSIERTTIGFDRASDHWLDCVIFEEGITRLGQSDNVDKFTELMELYRGAFLEGFYIDDAPEYEQWVLIERTRLRDMATNTFNHLVELFAARSELEQAIGYARQILVLEPWREETHRQLMRMLAQNGQRSSALAQYEICRQVLADELSVEPEVETAELAAQIRAGRLNVISSPKSGAASIQEVTSAPLFSSLPSPSTSFVGRQEEVATVRRLLMNEPNCRLLTLIGPGGMGKTRLALEVASGLMEEFPDGVAFVELAPVSSPAFIVSAAADVLGISFAGSKNLESQLLSALHSRHMLIVLDNFEHLLDGADLLSNMLASAPDIRLLVTSRERLNVQEEWNFHLHGMDFPSIRTQNEAELVTYSSIQLFLQRARQADASFQVHAEEIASIAQICQLVDGMPLGIELAAAWVHTLSCREIADEISQGLDLLTTPLRNVPERHRSLRVMFEQTWRRLSKLEQNVLGKLSIFWGGCTREAAATIAGATLPDLVGLMEKAVLRRSSNGRYDMHELLRQYAEEKLGETAYVSEEILREYSRYYAHLAHRGYERYLDGHFSQVIADFVQEIDNIRGALNWLLGKIKDSKTDKFVLEQLSLFVSPLSWFYQQRALYSEGIELFNQVIAALNDSALQPDFVEMSEILQARLQIRLANLFYLIGEYDNVHPAVTKALPVVRGADLTDEIALGLAYLAQVLRRRGHYAETRELADESEQLFHTTNNNLGRTIALGFRTLAAADEGNYAEAEEMCGKIISFYEELNDRPNLSRWLANLGNIYIRWGKHHRALRLLEKARALAKQDSNQFSLIITGTNLATVHRHLGDYAEAERYLREGLRLSREIGNPRWTAANLDGLCRNHLEQKNWDAAARCAHEALEFANSIRSDVDSMTSISRLAHAWVHQGKREIALRVLLYVEQHPSALQYDKENNAGLLAELWGDLTSETIKEAQTWADLQTVDKIIDWVRTL